MRIAQIILPGASEYERKSQRADHEALRERHAVSVVELDAVRRDAADVAHVYASGSLPAASFVRFPLPYVSSAPLPLMRWSLRKPVAPARVLSPAGDDPLPEVVEERYFGARHTPASGDVKRIASLTRPGVRNMVEQTLARIHRFRADVTWKLFTEPPAPETLAAVDLWVDPAMADSDYDGFVAEALVVGLPVVAARTPLNRKRLEDGRTGLLVPAGDPNEMTHAILSALFKPEVAESRQLAAKQTVSKFRARQRLRILSSLYESLTR